MEEEDRSHNENLILAANDKSRYIIFAESEDEDKIFWHDVIKKFAPEQVQNKYKITVLSNEKGKKWNGVYEIRQFLRTTKLNLTQQNVLFCIDSDAHYLLKDNLTQNKPYILQTYTYSIENHKSIPENLNKIAEKFGINFDFDVFLSEYSKIIYDFFLYWLAIKKIEFPIQEALATDYLPNEDLEILNILLKPITKKEHKKVIEIGDNVVNIANNGQYILANTQQKIVEWKARYHEELANFDIEDAKIYLQQNGFSILPEETFLYIRGHNLFSVILSLLSAVPPPNKKLKIQEIDNMQISPEEKIAIKTELYALFDHKKLADQSYKLCFENDLCAFMQKIGDDVKKYFANK